TYNSSLQNSVRVPDTLLFTRATLRNAQLGIQHRAITDYNFKLFKYINIAPQVSYEENWYPYTIAKILKPENRLVYDTIDQEGNRFIVVDSTRSQFGIDTTLRNYGFKTFRTYNAGVSANTTLFFTRQFKKGWFRGFRHKITPSVSVGFGPDFTRPRYRSFFGTYATDSRPAYADTLTYSIFDDGIYGKPSYNPRQVALGYSLGNVLEFKHRVRRDSLGEDRPNKKVTLFNNLAFSGSYSLTADTLKWSLVSTGGAFRLFKGVTNVNWNAVFDPYITDARGRRINKFAINEQHRLVRLTNFSFQFSTGFSISQVRQAFAKKSSPATTSNAVHDDLLGWFDNFRVSHNISFSRSLRPTGYGTTRDTFVISGNNISLNGSIPLNSKWSIDLNNISYDLISKKIVYPDLGITRDLHCWQMSISWQPTRGTYFFTINVKPGTLEFLKLPYQKNYYDARQ
ncbi:MAG: putative LPS assembly protein LptD, partial [Saprospiraceae bacterium]